MMMKGLSNGKSDRRQPLNWPRSMTRWSVRTVGSVVQFFAAVAWIVSARPVSRLGGVTEVELVPGPLVANVDCIDSHTAGALADVAPSKLRWTSVSLMQTLAAALIPRTDLAVVAVRATVEAGTSNFEKAMNIPYCFVPPRGYNCLNPK